MTTSRQVILVARPEGIPRAGHFELRAAPLPAPAGGPGPRRGGSRDHA